MKKGLIRGFTLIELLVVILILAILASMIVPKIVGRQSDAKRAKAASDLSVLAGQLQTFQHDCDRYPTTEEGLQALRAQPNNVDGWRGPYTTRDIPMDPWNHEYVYQCPGNNGERSFILKSYGSDGAEGGEGEASDIDESSD